MWQHPNPILGQQKVLDTPNTPEKQDLDLKSLVMMLLQENIKDRDKSLKEIQENMGKKIVANKEEMQKSLKEIQENFGQQAEVMKEETQKSLKELQKNTNKQVKELSKTIQDLKSEGETTKKFQRENRKPGEEIRGHRCKYQQQNTRDRRKNLKC